MTDRTDACRLEQAAEEYAAKQLSDICLMLDYEENKQIGYFHTYDIQKAYSDGYTACEQSMWRSVEVELPEDNQCVLALCVGGCMQLGYYDYSDELWFIDGFGAFNRDEIDFWMPILPPQLNSEKDNQY